MLIDIEEIKRKNLIVDEAIVKLKQEFVGIDDQIDEVMNNVRTWYLYPQLQTRPVVVSIFGLTGTGKTSLIRKIAKYLNIEKDLVYFNFAEIGEMHSYEIESTIEEELDNERSNRIFVYDEFQYAATLDESGAEKDNKSCLKPFWELMDSGVLHKRCPFWNIRGLYTALQYLLKINMTHPIEIVNGQWVNAEDCLRHFKPYDICQFQRCFNFEYNLDKEKTEEKKDDSHSLIPMLNDDFTKYQYFIKDDILEQLMSLMDKTNNRVSDRLECYNELCSKSFDEIVEIIGDVYDAASKGYDLKFNDSIIFIIANLDEAYTISFDVNPDMSPDQFHKITKKITIVDIKEALKRRFRNEQIARLGNIHVIYPSFSSETFRKLIDLNLNEVADLVKMQLGYNIRFADSIKKCIYQEAVYPTHGTRPVFSTIHEIVKSKIPEITRKIYEENIQDRIKYIEFTFKSKKTIILVYGNDDKVLIEIPFKEKLRLDNLRRSTKDEMQAMCAVHESGHFVVYSALTGKLPEKLVTKTTDSGVGGFILEQYDDKSVPSFKDVFNKIQVLLAGYVAEKETFGLDYTSNGASNDLERATILASKAIREWGFGNHPYITTYLLNHENRKLSGYAIRNEEIDSIKITNLLEKAQANVEDILKNEEWHKMFKESSQYMSINSTMPVKKMKELYDNVADSVKVNNNDRYYRDKLAEM